MSNPAVLILAELPSFKSLKDFRIEDNLGESIHVHLDSIRIDLSTDDFFELFNLFSESIFNLDGIDTSGLFGDFALQVYSATRFKKPVLRHKSELLCHYSFIERKVIGRIFTLFKRVDIQSSPHLAFLNSNSPTFLQYPQENYPGMSNSDRIRRRLSSAKLNRSACRLIVFGSKSKTVRDGMHGASVFAYLYGANSEIEVIEVLNATWRQRFVVPRLSTLFHIYKNIVFLTKRSVRSLGYKINNK